MSISGTNMVVQRTEALDGKDIRRVGVFME